MLLYQHLPPSPSQHCGPLGLVPSRACPCKVKLLPHHSSAWCLLQCSGVILRASCSRMSPICKAGKTSVGPARLSIATSKAERQSLTAPQSPAQPDRSHSNAGLPGAAAWLVLIIYYCFPSLLLPRSNPCSTVSSRGVKEPDFVSVVPDGDQSDSCTDASSALISMP